MIAGLVLAGGESRRMGHDKALISIQGQPAYLHAAQMLANMCKTVFISCRKEQHLTFTSGKCESLNNEAYSLIIEEETKVYTPIYDDLAFANKGPMTGILSWLNHSDIQNSDIEHLIVLGCDYRNMKSEFLENILATGIIANKITCYQNTITGIIDPLVAYYPIEILKKLTAYAESNSSLRLFIESNNPLILPLGQASLTALKSFDV